MDIMEKINNAILSLKENDNEYTNKANTYSDLVYDFSKDLTDEQTKQFNEIINLIGDIKKEELKIAFNTATDIMHADDMINKDFSIPYYIFEELVEYYQMGKPIARWNNLTSLMNLARANDRFTETQVERFKEMCK